MRLKLVIPALREIPDVWSYWLPDLAKSASPRPIIAPVSKQTEIKQKVGDTRRTAPRLSSGLCKHGQCTCTPPHRQTCTHRHSAHKETFDQYTRKRKGTSVCSQHCSDWAPRVKHGCDCEASTDRHRKRVRYKDWARYRIGGKINQREGSCRTAAWSTC